MTISNLVYQVLKTHTKEVLYEKYRTEKLLARRATRNISEDERQRLLEGMLVFFSLFPKFMLSQLRSRIVIHGTGLFLGYHTLSFNIPCNSLACTFMLHLFSSSGRNLRDWRTIFMVCTLYNQWLVE